MTDHHGCPAQGCSNTVPREMLACRSHWFSLPPDLRGRISETWRNGDTAAWLKARDEAVALLGGTPEL